MSDEDKPADATPETPEAEPDATPIAIAISKDVKNAVKASHDKGEVRQQVVEHLTKQEIDRRVELLKEAVARRAELQKALDKIKPDVPEAKDRDGKVTAVAAYTQPVLKQIQDAESKLNKLDKAIKKAVEDADYSQL
jgi:hypothetical protein